MFKNIVFNSTISKIHFANFITLHPIIIIKRAITMNLATPFV